MKTILKAAALITVLMFLTGCEENKEKENSTDFLGTWRIMTETFSYSIGDSTSVESDDFSDDSDVYWQLLTFDETSMEYCVNDLCSTGQTCEDAAVDYTSETIIITGMDSPGDTESYSYTISGNTLTLSTSFTVNAGTLTLEIVLEKHTNSNPPASWNGTADTDSYEPDNNVALANEITIGATGQNHEFVCSPDFIKFDADSGNTYKIDIDSDFDSYVTLYDSNGEYIDENDDAWPEDDEAGNDADATLFWNCDSAGTYFVEITDFGYQVYPGDYGEYGPYNVTVELVSGSAKITPATKLEKKRFRNALRHQFLK